MLLFIDLCVYGNKAQTGSIQYLLRRIYKNFETLHL